MKPLLRFSMIAAVLFGLINIEPAQARTCRVVYPERPHDEPKSAHLFDGIKSHSIVLPSMNLSEVIELPDGEITLYMTPEEVTDAKALPQNSPQLNIPGNVKDFFLIITRDEENQETPIRMEAIDASYDILKEGQTVWRNFTNNRIILEFGETGLVLDPQSTGVSKEPAAESGHIMAAFAYQLGGEGDVMPITEQIWRHDKNSKHLGIILSSGAKLPKIYFFRDFRLPSNDSAEEP